MLTNIDSIVTRIVCVTLDDSRNLLNSNECNDAIKLTSIEIHFFPTAVQNFLRVISMKCIK
jgi:hypothetical protein